MMHSRIVRVLIFLIGYTGSVFSLEMIPYSLPGRLYPMKEYVTVSGNEIGGIMAQMMHFTHSKHISGAAVYSSTFYRCGPADGNEADFQAYCTKNSPLPPDQQYQVEQSVLELQSYNTNQLIDSLWHLRYSHLYVYCGLENEDFRADQQLDVVALYEHYLESPYLIRSRVQDTAIQMRVVDTESYSYGPMCPRTPESDGSVSPNCTIMSVPAEGLGFILGKYINYVNPFYPYKKHLYLEPLWSFDQTEFTEDLPNAGLDDVGYYYVPHYCKARAYHGYGSGHNYNRGKPCPVHVYFHGCGQGREFLGTSLVKLSNYLEIAEANYIIMLFPQVLSNANNPRGCWDYVGWSGPLYATKQGEQIQAIWRMIERLLYISSDNPAPSPAPAPYPSPAPAPYPAPSPAPAPAPYKPMGYPGGGGSGGYKYGSKYQGVKRY